MQKTIIFIFFLLSTSLQAQKPMTLSACRKVALENNVELKKMQLQKLEAQKNVEIAKTAKLPSLSASATALYLPSINGADYPGGFLPTAESAEAAQNGEYSGLSNVWSPGLSLELNNLSMLMADISVTQPIYTGGKIKYSNRQAEIGVDISQDAQDLKRSEIIEQIDLAYWNIVKLSANLKSVKQYIGVLTELEEQMLEMQNIGITPGSETLKVSVQKNEAQLNLLRVENGLKASKMHLNYLLGQNLSTDIQLTDTLDLVVQPLVVSEGVQDALSNRKEIKILQKRLDISALEKKIEQADYLPQAGVSLSYTSTYAHDITDGLNFNPMVSAQVSIPIFQWGQAKHKEEAANLKIMQMQAELTNTNDLINLEVQNVKIQLEETYEAISLAQSNIQQTTENLSETQASFEAGLNTTSELLAAKADLQNAQTQLINAIAEYKILRTAWERVTGNLYFE